MKQNSLLCVRWWPLVFIGLPMLFTFPLLAFKWRYIESDVAYHTLINLQSINANWANVETMNRGRNVLITGSPPNQNAIDRAVQTAKSSFGVNSVALTSDVVAPPELATLSLIIEGEQVQLNGTVSSQAEIDGLLEKTHQSFGAHNVVNRLRVGDNTARLPFSLSLMSLLANNANDVKSLKVYIEKNTFFIGGDVQSKTTKRFIENNVQQRFKGPVRSALTVVSPPPEKPKLCQSLVTQLLNDEKIKFESMKSTISVDSFDLLANIKSIAERCPEASFEIAGHTDSSGTLSFNLALSEARAKAVLVHLINLGLDKARFNTAGYGPKHAIADNSTAQGRAKNRRIEFTLKN